MNTLLKLIEKDHSYIFSKEYRLPVDAWLKTSISKKVIWSNEFADELDPNKTTVIGGICGTKVSSLREMDAIGIKNIDQFRDWHLGWFPRIDQVHDAVGIPVKSCKKIVYIFEDTTHADRIINIRKDWHKLEVQEILKEAHLKDGHRVLGNWLKLHGFTGDLSFIFLSELEKEIKLGLRVASKLGFESGDTTKRLRKLMYTSIWPSVLGIDGDALVFEPIHYIKRHQSRYKTLLDKIGIISYIPYLSGSYELDQIPHKEIPNLSNFSNFLFEGNENFYSIINLLFAKKDLLENISLADSSRVQEFITQDLHQYFQ